MTTEAHIYHRRVAYHETDAMAVVHHSNYLKWFEEARCEWLRDAGLMAHHQPYGPYVFALIRQQSAFYRPAIFDDQLEIWTQAKIERAIRICFQYAVYCIRLKRIIAQGSTELAALTSDFKPARLPKPLAAEIARRPWDESWPPTMVAGSVTALGSK